MYIKYIVTYLWIINHIPNFQAGFDWREPGCSMCLGMNPDRLKPQETNRLILMGPRRSWDNHGQSTWKLSEKNMGNKVLNPVVYHNFPSSNRNKVEVHLIFKRRRASTLGALCRHVEPQFRGKTGGENAFKGGISISFSQPYIYILYIHIFIYLYTRNCIYTYIYIYVCVCVSENGLYLQFMAIS
jgi:hypothetical protein